MPCSDRKNISIRLLTDLDEKPIEGEGILVQHNPANVTDDLSDTADGHGCHKGPRSPFDSLYDLDDHGDSKQCNEDGIARNSRAIIVDAGFDGACIWTGQCAIGVRAI